MKHIYLLVLACITFSMAQAQNIYIPDPNFKNALINEYCADFDGDGYSDGDVDTNNDNEIQVSEAEAVLKLDLEDYNIYYTIGLEYFVNLIELDLTFNNLQGLDISQLTQLELLILPANQITSLDLSNNLLLNRLEVSENQLTQIDLSQNVSLEHLTITQNQLQSLDMSHNLELLELYCSNNPLEALDISQNSLLEQMSADETLLPSLDISNTALLSLNVFNSPNLFYINAKNGKSVIFYNLINCNNLSYVCIDNKNYDFLFNYITNNSGLSNVTINSYCSFVPGGDFYTMEGQNKIDLNNNGCDINDIVYPSLKLNITNNGFSNTLFSNSTESYSIPITEGDHTIRPVLENPDYFNVSPESFTVDFPSDASPYTQDFCITPNGEKDDLEIVIIPLNQARPGFDADYKIIYKNKGSTTLTGTLELIYNENAGLMDFVSATPNIDSDIANVLTWSYSNLQPFQTREILVTFNLNTPTETPPLNDGDPLGLVANIYPLETDETLSDNNFQLKQIVVNSLDPNDKTCLQGEIITPDQVGKYVHYMIRFENTGTASAVNIVVKDEIDLAKYDVSTLIPLHASHDFVTNIKEDNIVEFIFEDINLPFDDANNDGYVAFKIKTLATLALGDSFANDAEIYFDYNAPIITNNEETTIGENLSVEETSMQDFVTMYPNPINNVLHIKSKNALETVSIYDVNGRQLQTISFTGNKLDTEINTSAFSQGVYFVKIKTEIGIQTTKIIKN
ncbi:T9SS type A sorting domain-containing protein [Lacinutrix himadriensis]|uniref:T9SS type A sorting domain-containing protein n=1 Tax=Lacinutrix himadriensis TaxID=641549 RepID=UPI0009FA16E1|nr:T9SS type A sorting domain-containing protein [Lacinutrix himadriensis]